MQLKQKITPFLWFGGNAEEVANFYTSVFQNSKIMLVTMETRGQDKRVPLCTSHFSSKVRNSSS
jgi:predicted 3-demethylubiquinone-9 3-methyltransferase (glyoxalase superfamily)